MLKNALSVVKSPGIPFAMLGPTGTGMYLHVHISWDECWIDWECKMENGCCIQDIRLRIVHQEQTIDDVDSNGQRPNTGGPAGPLSITEVASYEKRGQMKVYTPEEFGLAKRCMGGRP
jgi:hypothetical protein